ncbi:MAG: DUF2088 domain-containing protein [Lachnospiraceae bacterium]|nr:DUF2088 domain-containing protein [Lachnospiraceae bacterium]
MGILPSGVPLVIDKAAAETELLLAEGFIEPHFFAGFSGGRKAVLPGICDRVHPPDTNTTWVMYGYVSSNCSLTNQEKAHLAQVY